MKSAFDKESWDEFIEQMERTIMQDYSEVVSDRIMNPRNSYKLENANGHTRYTGPCGDTIEIWVRVVDGVIEEISFCSYGCGITQAVGSMITELAKGKEISDALNIEPEQIIDALDGLPEENKHCALLARDSLHRAIKNYEENL